MRCRQPASPRAISRIVPTVLVYHFPHFSTFLAGQYLQIDRADGRCTSSNSPETNAHIVGSFHLTRQCVLVEMGCDHVCSMHTIPTASAFIREDADLLVQLRDKASTDYGKISGDAHRVRRECHPFPAFLTKRLVESHERIYIINIYICRETLGSIYLIS